PLERAVLQLASSNRNASSSLGNYANIAAWVDNIDTDFASFMEGSGGNHDFIDINGDLTLNLRGGITVETLNGYTGVFGDVFNLLDWVDLTNNGFTIGDRYRLGTETGLDLVLPTLAASYQWDTSLFASHGVLVVVPEPTRATLLTAAFAFLLLQRRRRK
ncbi:hypothetical protein, partial [Phragmitibacter flavus]|uniref:hypothetical protein n=1 Tax=Phragmitibacter flavus TaxID=2576071 RepID=UPI001407CF3A